MGIETHAPHKIINRPIFISVFCVLNWLLYGINFIRLFGIDNLLESLSSLPFWYIVLTQLAIYPAFLYGTYEIWHMRRRGIVIYAVTVLLTTIVWIIVFRQPPKIGFIAMNSFFIVLSYFYYRMMA